MRRIKRYYLVEIAECQIILLLFGMKASTVHESDRIFRFVFNGPVEIV